MNRILGIDLGTNSIGITIREFDREFDEFVLHCVHTFRKGVGEEEGKGTSLALERTKHRSSRRLYNSRRYRKWETLKILIKMGYCPLPADKLKNWKHYRKGIGRVFPVDDIKFGNWIKLDFNGDGSPDYKSPYQLRKELISEKLDLTIPENRYRIGRALYHIAQRRGFKSSRKHGSNEKTAVYKGSNKTKTIGRNEYENLIKEHGALGAAFAHIEDQGIRVRNRYTLRSDFRDEVSEILKYQCITDTRFKEDIQKAIFFQRPLRSQKGLIGKCTLESNKPRCPISHPQYEEYRAWSFINNIKYRIKSDAEFEPLPLSLKERLYNEKFFLKAKDLEFSQIRKFIEIHGGKDWELNYSHKMDNISVSSCPVSARLRSVFGENWQKFEKSILRKNKKGNTKSVTYKIEDIWHILFSFEDEEYFEEFLKTVLELDEQQIKELKTLFNSFPVGYASLSLKAINSILPFLKEGIIYSEAVILAKIPEIIGTNLFAKDKANILEGIKHVIKENQERKMMISIANNLIFKYYALDSIEKFGWKDTAYQLTDSDLYDIQTAATEHFGEKTWELKNSDYKQKVLQKVKTLYQAFFASSKREHIKPPHLVDEVKQFISDNFEVNKLMLDKIYHPSQISIYPKKEGQQYLKSPKTAAFKNPMAYKTLYKLRDVINYLIETQQIDEDTRIVVEIARELNDSNRRLAIEKYQRDRESENRSYAAAIGELIKENNFRGFANPQSSSDIDKFRIWTEQMDNHEEIKQKINAIENSKNMLVTEKDIRKYRLWKEQNCRCIYTGKIISMSDLFDINTVDFEHTIPRSKSFDNSLANLTVCYADYNRKIKNNQIPTELPNYDKASHGYSAISPRLEKWKERVNDLYEQINSLKKKSKTAIDKKSKDKAIQQRHLKQMDYDYWKNKLDRFTRKEIPTGFVNSQLVDTQIITKYALHYLKTVFNKVDVIKASTTADFRKIYGIQPKDETKDRSMHSHHAIDAAVLTLIPPARKREEILKRAYDYEEQNKNKQYHELPFTGFNNSMIEEIQNSILINNLPEKDNILTPGKKIVRKRGRIVWLDKEKKIPKIATGDSVRGELHLQTNYGKIKIAAKNEKGTILKDDHGNILYNQVKVKGQNKDEIWMVLRKPIEKVNFASDVIIDSHLETHLKQQLENGTKQNELKDFQGKKLRRLRCRAKAARGFMNPDNATEVKQQAYKSSKEYKNYIYANSGDNYMFGWYENESGNRDIISINKFEAAKYIKEIGNLSNKNELFALKEPVLIKKKEATLIHVFKVGQRVLFCESLEEIRNFANDRNELSKRLYFIKRLHDASVGNILFQHHLEARSDDELTVAFPKETFKEAGKNGFRKYRKDFIAPRILFKPTKPVFIIEGKDFEMKLDGSIIFKF